MLLEKAYAKAYGSYLNIEGGDPATALRDLTGAPTVSMDCENTEKNEKLIKNLVNKLWKFVGNAEKNDWIICCYTGMGEVREEQTNIGIVKGHAYTILDVRELTDAQGVSHRLVKIRNPWG